MIRYGAAVLFLTGCVSAPTAPAAAVGATAAELSDMFLTLENDTYSSCAIPHYPNCTPAPRRAVSDVVCRAGAEPGHGTCAFVVEWEGGWPLRCEFDVAPYSNGWALAGNTLDQCGPWGPPSK